jgi:SAM-dependent methyltransferase
MIEATKADRDERPAVHPVANVDMARAWDGDEGADWARDWRRYDRAVRAHHARLLAAAAIAPGELVLDVGCGNGETTRAAARAAWAGAALGVDLSARMIDRAVELAAAERLANVRFVQADAQVHAFAPGGHDVAVSRFGTMFFADPVEAFANIGRALRPGGRLVMVGWRGVADNEWLRCVLTALADGRDLPTPPPGAPGPFGLADPDLTRRRLATAGFTAVEIEAFDAPFHLGDDGDDADRFFRGTALCRGLTAGLDVAGRARALAALQATLHAHDTGDGVELGSGAWLITARPPG